MYVFCLQFSINHPLCSKRLSGLCNLWHTISTKADNLLLCLLILHFKLKKQTKIHNHKTKTPTSIQLPFRKTIPFQNEVSCENLASSLGKKGLHGSSLEAFQHSLPFFQGIKCSNDLPISSPLTRGQVLQVFSHRSQALLHGYWEEIFSTWVN